MSVGFGFSVGDFVAAIDLLRQVGAALKENGGARDDYLKTITRLETTKVILSCIANLGPGQTDSATIHAIHCQARLIQTDVEQFLSKIEKYRDTLGSNNGKRICRSALHKIKWSQFVASEVEKLFQDVDGKIATLDLLFNLHLSDASSKQCEEIVLTRESILYAIDKNSESPNHPIQPVLDNALVKQDLDALVTGLQGLTSGHAKAASDMLSSMATKDDIQDLKLLLNSRLQSSIPGETSTLVSKETDRLLLVSTLLQLSLPVETVTWILRNFYAEFTVIVQIFFTSFLNCLRDLLLALPHLVLLYRVLKRLPPVISLVLHDNISFEDALGRMHSLQFQQFKHWSVFETSLRCTFQSVPGKLKVENGNYALTSPEHQGQLTAQNWSLTVRPGFVVKMSIILTQIFVDGRQCPRGCGSATYQVTTAEYRCETCSLVFAALAIEQPCLSDLEGDRHNVKDMHYNLRDTGLHHSQRAWTDSSLSLRNSSQTQSQTLSNSSLREESEELKIFKRIQLPEKAGWGPDTTGQVRPPGMKLSVTLTRWEDEATLCFQVEVNGIVIARREDNHFVNGTKLLDIAGLNRGHRDGILKSEQTRNVVKIGPMHLKGSWIPLERALDFANHHKITEKLYPLFVHDIKGLLLNPKGLNRDVSDQTSEIRNGNARDETSTQKGTFGDSSDMTTSEILLEYRKQLTELEALNRRNLNRAREELGEEAALFV